MRAVGLTFFASFCGASGFSFFASSFCFSMIGLAMATQSGVSLKYE